MESFEHDRWDVHLLNLSSEMDTRDLLATLISCNLIRIGSNNYTGRGDKSVLIVLQGMERLNMTTSSNNVFEFFRSLYDFGRVLTPSGESIKFTSVVGLLICTAEIIVFKRFLADYTVDGLAPQWLPIPERFKRFVFPVYFHETVHIAVTSALSILI